MEREQEETIKTMRGKGGICVCDGWRERRRETDRKRRGWESWYHRKQKRGVMCGRYTRGRRVTIGKW